MVTAETRPVRLAEKGWPQFRGPHRDGVSLEEGLLREWPEKGPDLLWSSGLLGKGYSSPILQGERIFITGDVAHELHITALDLAGKMVWKATNGSSWKDPYPGSRSSVTVYGPHLFHLNAHGRMAAINVDNGREVWSTSILTQFKANNITWGLSECLLADDKAVYVTAGGEDALLVAFNKNSGSILWKSAPLRDSNGEKNIESSSYSSPILVQNGTRQLIIGCSVRHAFCVDSADGKIIWTHRFPTTYNVLSMMPTLVGDAVFITAPHGRGGKLLRIHDGSEIWTTKLDSLQGSVVVAGDLLIGSFYGGRKGWAAISRKTGEVRYDTSDFIKGTPLLADNRVYALCEDGQMLLLEAGETGFERKGRFRFVEANRDAWAHPVILDGRLYLRYHDQLSCYRISKN